jgi:hypothetical protein
MFLFGSAVNEMLRRRLRNIRRWMENAEQVQHEFLPQLLLSAKNTEWGKQFNYAEIKNVEDFKKQIPIQDYDSLKPFIQRTMRGEQNLIWSSPIRWFSKSSGTTSDTSKFIPMSEASIEDCHFKGATDLMACYCEAVPGAKIFNGKGLIIGGSHQVNKLDTHSRCGDLSAVLLENMPVWTRIYRTPALSIALMNDWQKKIDAIAQSTLHEHVTNISGVPTWTIVVIQKLFEITGENDLKKIWPNLELYIHGGVNFEPYRSQFQNMIHDSKMHYYQTYNASEGFFGFQFEPNDIDLLLHADAGIFYEFMPAEEAGKDYPKTLQLNEVTTGVNYALIISTNAGLWRYTVGDTIQFTSLRPFKIQVTGRLKSFINAFGEEVIVENADAAISEACKMTGATIRDYTACPIYLSLENKGGHEWLIEFEDQPGDIEKFKRVLDETLRKVNSDYDAKRAYDLALLPPVIHNLPSHTFEKWLAQKGKLGGQHKVPRLCNNRKIVEEILKTL